MSLRQNAFLLAVLTALIAIIADWTNAPALASMWRLPAGLLLLGLAYEIWWVRRALVSVELSSDTRAVLGKPLTVKFAWRHALRRDVVVEYAADTPPASSLVSASEIASEGNTSDSAIRTVRAAPNTLTTEELIVLPRQLGAQTWPKIRARVCGPIGFAWWPLRLHPLFTFHAQPDLLQTAEQRNAASASGKQARKVSGSGSEIIQLREYRAGDAMRSVDWKATARIGKLISRDFSEDQHLEIIIAIDAGRASRQRCGSLDRLGHYANIAARFAQHAIANDDRVGLVVFADRPLTVVPPIRGLAAVLRIRTALTAMQSNTAESNPLYAALRISKLVRHRSLIVMLTDLDDTSAAGQLAAAMRLLLPKHLPLVAGLASVESDQLAHAPSRHWLDSYQSLAAQEYALHLQRSIQLLHNLGAPALAVYPEQLERAVFAAYEGFRERRRV